MKSVAVFCGSRKSHSKSFQEAAIEVGKRIAQKKMTLVYGGSNVGLMGRVADGALSEGGEVIGVIPNFLDAKETRHPHLTQLEVVQSMHERKQRMFELSQGFIALPGGFGTMDEVFEILTWAQLGLHSWPIAFLDVDGCYQGLRDLFKRMHDDDLLSEDHLNLPIFESDIDKLILKMSAFKPLPRPPWMTKIQQT